MTERDPIGRLQRGRLHNRDADYTTVKDREDYNRAGCPENQLKAEQYLKYILK